MDYNKLNDEFNMYLKEFSGRTYGDFTDMYYDSIDFCIDNNLSELRKVIFLEDVNLLLRKYKIQNIKYIIDKK